MAPPFYTREQLFQAPTITGIISQIDVPGSLFQRTYVPRGLNERVTGRTASWDLFNNTRSIGTVSAPRAQANTRSRKPYGNRSVQMIRMFEKMPIWDEDLNKYRPPGGQFNQIDEMGLAWVKSQLRFFSTIFRNTREWCLSRMFRGGFSAKISGESFQLVEKGDANAYITVDYGIPAEHTGTVNGIFTDEWDTPATTIVNQFLELDKYHARVNSRPLRHVWLNGTTAQYLMENEQLQSVRGTSMRIFDSITQRPIDENSKLPDTGYDIVFGALPLIRFHVYNQGLVKSGTPEDFASQIDSANFEHFIPDDYIMIHPEPGDWMGMMTGSELVRENLQSEPIMRYGFHGWSMPFLNPSGYEIFQVDNFMPILYEPYAIYYIKVANRS